MGVSENTGLGQWALRLPRCTASMFLCSWRRGKSHFLPLAQHLKPAIVVRHPGLIGFGQRVNQLGVEDGTQPRFEYCALACVRGVGAEIDQFFGIDFKVEELWRRADIVDVLWRSWRSM